ncbi:transcriptional regulator [Acinetobacter baumannii]|uniref:ArsR/SmtB family transcription factor n=1 Tax=Acinetobacter baumannii TaxID=470 RepID=UPI0008DEA5C2|nr:metalloregulator ArsR/SmtB family transcription factor [Acinetobacter baumannii]OIH12179.1 transcriptional regulator [Acinetobacter baumannii]
MTTNSKETVPFNGDLKKMKNSADTIVGVLKSAANPDRLLILCNLAYGELNVAQIEEKTQVPQPTLSQQLGMLRKSGVVSTRREGKQIFYSIKDRKMHTILNTLYQLYCAK